jgi:hypothetical protein
MRQGKPVIQPLRGAAHSGITYRGNTSLVDLGFAEFQARPGRMLRRERRAVDLNEHRDARTLAARIRERPAPVVRTKDARVLAVLPPEVASKYRACQNHGNY